MKKLGLAQRIVIGTIAGIVLGFVLGPNASSLKFMGDIFLRLVKMCVPFVIFCSIVESTSSIKMEELGKIGRKTLFIFFVSTTLAACMSIFSTILFPMQISQDALATLGGEAASYGGQLPTGNFLDVLVAFFPENIVQSFANSVIAQIIVFGALFGIALNLKSANEAVHSIKVAVKGIRQLMMTIISFVMYLAPFGIGAMIADVVGKTGTGVLSILTQVVVMVTAVNIVFFALFTLFVCVKCKLSIATLLRKSARIIVICTTTGASAVALPIALEDVPKRLGVSEKISNFILPLGNAINTNGAPISNLICAVACANLYGINLTTQNLVMITIYAIVSSFGNPGVPGGGIVSLAVVFTMSGLPSDPAAIGIFAGLDYFFSLTRVTVNVMGSVYASLLVAEKNKELDHNTFAVAA